MVRVGVRVRVRVRVRGRVIDRVMLGITSGTVIVFDQFFPRWSGPTS